MWEFNLVGELPDLNHEIGGLKKHWSVYAIEKKRQQHSLQAQILQQVGRGQKKRLPLPYPVKMQCTWFCAHRRKDPDNIAFAKKYILDALVEAGVLKNDGWKQIASFEDRFHASPTTPWGVSVKLEEAELAP